MTLSLYFGLQFKSDLPLLSPVPHEESLVKLYFTSEDLNVSFPALPTDHRKTVVVGVDGSLSLHDSENKTNQKNSPNLDGGTLEQT